MIYCPAISGPYTGSNSGGGGIKKIVNESIIGYYNLLNQIKFLCMFIFITCVIFTELVFIAQQTYPRKSWLSSINITTQLPIKLAQMTRTKWGKFLETGQVNFSDFLQKLVGSNFSELGCFLIGLTPGWRVSKGSPDPRLRNTEVLSGVFR